jgi:putative phage-type endonuclease
MKTINVEQGSKEWLRWRKTVITATDCPAILGTSPWQTAYKCWQRKLDLVDAQPPNAAMARGIKLEPEARAKFNDTYGFDMQPAVVESTEYTFLGSSLDGITPCGRFVVEIKCGGESLQEMARNGIIPDYYLDQIQHQLLVTGAEKAYYYSYDGKSGTCIDVLPDPGFKDRFLSKAVAFCKCIAYFEPPAMTHKDYQDMSDNLSWKDYAKQYADVDIQLKAFEEKKDYLRKKLIELSGEQSSQGAGIKVMKIISKGRVDYEQIPELKSVDLDKYRKNSSSLWKIITDRP